MLSVFQNRIFRQNLNLSTKITKYNFCTHNQEATTVLLKNKNQDFHIIGVSHNSLESSIRITNELNKIRPDIICLELCNQRYEALKINIAVNYRSITSYLSNYIYYKLLKKNIYKHGPFIEAIKYAFQYDTNIKCVDMSSNSILEQFQLLLNDKNMKLNNDNIKIDEIENMKYFTDNNIGYFNNDKNVELSRNDAREILKSYSNEIYDILHKKRDEYMIKNMIKCKGDTIVLIVGIAHMDNIIENWDIYKQEKIKNFFE